MNTVPIIKFIDKYIGAFLIFILQFFKSKKKILKTDKNILVIRLWTLGESLLVSPTLKKLKEKGYTITVLVSKRSELVFKRLDFVDKIIYFEDLFKLSLLFKKFDVAIDTEPYENISALLGWYLAKKSVGYKGLFREKLYTYKIQYDDKIHTSAMIAKLLVPFNIHFIPKELIPLTYTKQEIRKVDALLAKKSLAGKSLKERIIGIHAGTAESAPWRSWKTKRFAELSDELSKKGFYVILTGLKSESKLNENIISLSKNKKTIFNFAGETNVYELSYLLTKMAVFVSNDTGTMHLSAAMGVKTIGLFGPNLPNRFSPLGKNNISIYHGDKLSCSPCINVHKGEFKNCKINGECMDYISVKEVYDSVLKLVGEK